MIIRSTAFPVEMRRNLGSWMGGLAGPFAWFLQLVGVFALTPRACSGHGRLILHVLSLLCLILTVAGCGVVWTLWGEVGREWPSSTEDPEIGRRRLMGAIGVVGGLLFAWIICTQWIAIGVLDPCPP